MPRALIVLILVIVLLVGGLFFLSRVNTEQPLTRIEKPIANDKLAK